MSAPNAETIWRMFGKYRPEALTNLQHSSCAAQNATTHSENTAKTLLKPGLSQPNLNFLLLISVLEVQPIYREAKSQPKAQTPQVIILVA